MMKRNKLEEKITIPGYELSMAAGIATIITTTILASLIFLFTPLGIFLRKAFPELYIFTLIFLIGNYACSIVMFVSGIMIRHEDHCLSGSVLILIVSVMGLIFGVGLYLGPILGIVAGVTGLKEHHSLLKAHHGMLHEHHELLAEHHKKLLKK